MPPGPTPRRRGLSAPHILEVYFCSRVHLLLQKNYHIWRGNMWGRDACLGGQLYASHLKRSEFRAPEFWGFSCILTQNDRILHGDKGQPCTYVAVAFAQMRRAVCHRQLTAEFLVSYDIIKH